MASGTIDSDACSELEADEKLIWSGQPPTGVRLRATDAFLIPFSLLWGGFAFFWEGMALLAAFGAFRSQAGPISGVALIFPIFGIPFVLVGCYLIFGRFFVDARERQRTSYALTNQRIIIVSGLIGREVKSLQLRGLNDVSLSERADGTGTIKLGASSLFAFDMGMSWPGLKGRSPPMLDAIPDARSVYRKILEAQKSLTR